MKVPSCVIVGVTIWLHLKIHTFIKRVLVFNYLYSINGTLVNNIMELLIYDAVLSSSGMYAYAYAC